MAFEERNVITLGLGSAISTLKNFIVFGLVPRVAGTWNYIITLGIGSPAAIPPFILFGLSPKVPGTIGATLHERDFGSGNLHERDDISLTLPER